MTFWFRFFHKEVKSYLDGAKVMSVFDETGTGKFRLKEHIQLHLFLNHPPPGDYRECLDL